MPLHEDSRSWFTGFAGCVSLYSNVPQLLALLCAQRGVPQESCSLGLSPCCWRGACGGCLWWLLVVVATDESRTYSNASCCMLCMGELYSRWLVVCKLGFCKALVCCQLLSRPLLSMRTAGPEAAFLHATFFRPHRPSGSGCLSHGPYVRLYPLVHTSFKLH